jgi:hypothetical protein
MLKLNSPVGATSHWSGGVEVFNINGVSYVKGSPPDLSVKLKSGVEVLLKEYKGPKVVLCSRHKNYKAIRKPRTNCEECWEAYESIQGPST